MRINELAFQSREQPIEQRSRFLQSYVIRADCSVRRLNTTEKILMGFFLTRILMQKLWALSLTNSIKQYQRILSGESSENIMNVRQLFTDYLAVYTIRSRSPQRKNEIKNLIASLPVAEEPDPSLNHLNTSPQNATSRTSQEKREEEKLLFQAAVTEAEEAIQKLFDDGYPSAETTGDVLKYLQEKRDEIQGIFTKLSDRAFLIMLKIFDPLTKYPFNYENKNVGSKNKPKLDTKRIAERVAQIVPDNKISICVQYVFEYAFNSPYFTEENSIKTEKTFKLGPIVFSLLMIRKRSNEVKNICYAEMKKQMKIRESLGLEELLKQDPPTNVTGIKEFCKFLGVSP